MRYIDKTNKEPEDFKRWKAAHDAALQAMYVDENVTGDDVWRYLDQERATFNKSQLKSSLVEEQGYICCYCGQRIFKDSNTRIEHCSPKSDNKALTYEYNNLLASCQGGSKDVLHIVQAGETLATIAEKHGVAVAHLESIYVNADNIQVWRQEPDLEGLKVGDRLIIFKKVSGKEQHCDNRKGGNTIDISPLQADCSDHFSYHKLNGSIYITEASQNTITVLGLNDNAYLKQNRLKIINEATRKLKILIGIYLPHQVVLFQQKRNLLIQQLETVDAEGCLRPWCFVEKSVLQGK